MKRICEIVAHYLTGWAMLNLDIVRFNAVGDVEILNIDVLGALCQAKLTVVGEQNSRLVILIYHCFLAHIPLFAQKMSGSENLW